MKKILIVEDEPNMVNGLKDNLEFEGYEIDTATEGNTGLQKVLENKYDLILLDIMLPGVSGLDICRNARKKGVDTPIILLTAKGEEIDKVLGLELGADDYITKPFSLRELLARIKAIMRRAPAAEDGNGKELVKIGNIQVNFKNYVAVDGDHEIKMSHKEYEILHYLYKNEGKTVDRDDLMSNVWSIDYDITTRTVDNFILKLRQKVESDPNNPKIILTVHGIGYKMVL
ncbi:MAG TPA: response regulator transcription factor [Bacteroidales bacterium]|jgi:DNA-binding response OmpR family regulator|nr:response regulator transcription factor [Bacteroidales bacterium]